VLAPVACAADRVEAAGGAVERDCFARRGLDRHAGEAGRVLVGGLELDLDLLAPAARVAAAFDPPALRGALSSVAAVTVRHRQDSLAAGLLFCGWLSSRLGWRPDSLVQRGDAYSGHARGRRQDVLIKLELADQNAPGLAGVTIETAAGEAISLDRSPGGLAARRRDRDGVEQTWTVLGASRGEGGILGEGVRQALLRDPTYGPALACARAMVS